MPRYGIDAGDGVEVRVCVEGDLTPATRDALAAVGRAAARSFCDHFITAQELGSDDEWAGTYCKLLSGHAGPHSALYPDERAAAPRQELSREENPDG